MAVAPVYIDCEYVCVCLWIYVWLCVSASY